MFVGGITSPHMTYQYPTCKICVELYQLFIELGAEDRKKIGRYIIVLRSHFIIVFGILVEDC
jgi:hypothetical protein